MIDILDIGTSLWAAGPGKEVKRHLSHALEAPRLAPSLPSQTQLTGGDHQVVANVVGWHLDDMEKGKAELPTLS